jgi:hypothetical protein
LTQSSLKTDVVGIWTNTKTTVNNGRVEGREKREWVTVLGAYFGLMIATSLLAKISGADNLLDYFFGNEASQSDWAFTIQLTAGLVVVVIILSFLQWRILPIVSGWFGGSKNRQDATLAYYYFFCAGISFSLMTIVIDIVSVGLQHLATPYGSYLAAASIVFIVFAGIHISVRIIEAAQFVKSHARSLGISLISFLIVAISLLLIAFAAVTFLTILFPNIWDAAS